MVLYFFFFFFFLLKNVHVGERARCRRQAGARGRGARGPSAPQWGWGQQWGAFVPVPHGTVGQSRGWWRRRGSAKEKVWRERNGGTEGGLQRPSCRRRRRDPGSSRFGGERKPGPRRGELQEPGGTEPRAGEHVAPALPPSCPRRRCCLRPTVAVTPCVPSAPAAAAPASLSGRTGPGAVPAPKHCLVRRVGGGGRGGPM